MSNQLTHAERAHFQQLLMGAVDNELTFEEQAEFNGLINKYPHLKKEWQQYQKLKEVTKTMKLTAPSPETWDKYWLNVYNRIERGIGWIILSIGAIILVTYSLFKMVESILADTQLIGIIKVGILAVIAGIVILTISVLREKLFTKKSDPYKEVQR